MPGVRAVSDATFVEEVLLAQGPVLVDFWAAWCKPCRAISPVVQQFADRNQGRITVVKVDADKNRETVAAYGVKTIPTLMLFRGGRSVSAVTGALPKKTLEFRLRAML